VLSPINPATATTHSNNNNNNPLNAFVPRVQLNNSDNGYQASFGGKHGGEITKVNQKAALAKIFPDAYQTTDSLRPSEHDVHLVRLTKNKRLTPESYSRNIFHLEFDISGTGVKYEIGDALGVYGHNDVEEIDHFIAEYGLDPNAIVAVPARGRMEKSKTEMVSVRNLLIQHLDILGKPSKKFYVALAQHAHRGGSRYEYLKLMHTGTDDNEAFKLGSNEGVTYAELLLHYKSANPTIEEIVEMVPPIQARHYSIASSMRMNPRSVHLLVVAVDWITPKGRKKYGQCTRYLANLDPSKGKDIYVAVDVMPSVLRLPPNPKQPIIMSGLGTGMAPFRAFIQERKYQKEMGIDVGPCVLFFGARHRHEEWLYGDEWDAYEREGLVTHLGLAFSRDQKEKIYIQDRIKQKKELLADLLGKEKRGYAYLCGPTWPVPAIAQAFRDAGLDADELKDEGRYILEVY
jgi:sulfite reductase (NADPH) flavoprotein alpha-component